MRPVPITNILADQIIKWYWYIKNEQVFVTQVVWVEEGHIKAVRWGVRTPPTNELPETTEVLEHPEAFYAALVAKGLMPPVSGANDLVGKALTAIFSLGNAQRKRADYGKTLWAVYSTSDSSETVIPSLSLLLRYEFLAGQGNSLYALLLRAPIERIDPSYFKIG
jgi:hypothetical protein